MSYLGKAKETFINDGVSVFLTRLVDFSIVKCKRMLFKRIFEQRYVSWAGLKNSSKGKTLFILGNGPSLNITPLYLLNHEDTFCFNRFNLMFDRLNWRPTYYMVTDDLVIQDMRDEIPDILNQVNKAFFPDLHPSNVDFTKLIEDNPNIYWLDTSNPAFSKDLPRCGINKTVTNAAIQIGAYLGYSKICFLGVDVNYSNQKVKKSSSRNWTAVQDDDPNHFDPKYFGEGRSYHNPSTLKMIEKFREAQAFFSDENIEFYNVGVGGNLDVFPRTTIAKILGLSEEVILNKFILALPSQFSADLVHDFLHSIEKKLVIDEGSFLTRELDSPDKVSSMLKEFKVIGPCCDVYAVY